MVVRRSQSAYRKSLHAIRVARGAVLWPLTHLNSTAFFKFGGGAALLLAYSGESLAASFDAAYSTTNDYGDVGLLQTPTARMRADGEFGVGISAVKPYNQVHLFLQTLPWLETALRYTAVTDRRYGAESFSGNQSYKDKSADLKVRLLNEGTYWPAIALGIQDLGGTGVFSSEYLVSSLHYYDFDFSAGLGWGRLGSSGGIKNPFTLISNHFDKERSTETAGAGGLSRLFTGREISPFGGVQWNTPIHGLSLEVEYDPNNYQHEALGNKFPQSSPVNVGATYRGFRGVDFGVGYERGEIFTARIALHFNFQSYGTVAKYDDPPLPPIGPPAKPAATMDASPAGEGALTQPAVATGASPEPAAAAPSTAAEPPKAIDSATEKKPAALQPLTQEQKTVFLLAFKRAIRKQGFDLAAADFGLSLDSVKVWVSGKRYRNPAKATGRVARSLSELAPEQIKHFTIVDLERGVETYQVSLQREAFEAAVRGQIPYDSLSTAVTLSGADNEMGSSEFIDKTLYPSFFGDMGPAVRQYVGGPDSFYIGQLYWRTDGSVALTDHLTLSGAAGINIYNNFDKLKQQSNSLLPHVRSDIVNYLKKGQNDLIKLEANYIWSPLPDLYTRLSGGIFEEMYAGVGAEALYRPYGRPWAIGVDVNKVYQRGFDQLLDFRDYSVVTGHVTLYYQLPFYHLLGKVSVGRYLARDKGATFDLSREFASGIRAGVFATKTNVSAAQFGEGRFDKGLYLSIPLDLFFTQSTRDRANILFRPLTRDGGQKVRDGEELYPIVDQGKPSDFANGWSELPH